MTSRLDLSRLKRRVEETAQQHAAASRSLRDEQPAREEAVTVEPDRPKVTARVVDDAVDAVLSKLTLQPEEEFAIRKLLSQDHAADFATSLFMDKAKQRLGSVSNGSLRMNVRPVLQQEEVVALTTYAPEYDFNFLGIERHDHGLFSAMRAVDHKLLLSRVARGASVKDVGGNPLYYIRAGIENVHVCAPLEDRKDPSRHMLRTLEAKKIMRDMRSSEASRRLARRFLEKDETFVCDKKGQDCDHKAQFVILLHVYDIPLEDYAKLYEKSGAVAIFGCLNFPLQAYDKTEGVTTGGLTYNLSPSSGKIRMGFKDSSAWLYDHNWPDLMRFGADQLIRGAKGSFSYKVVERRQDTYHYEVLRVPDSVGLGKQFFRVPGVKMVRVDGFELGGDLRLVDGKKTGLRPRVYNFPLSLWQDLYKIGSVEYERGKLTFQSLYARYRDVAPANSLNGVLISGGVHAERDMIVPLITHVGIAIIANLTLSQRESAYLVADVMREREWERMSLLSKSVTNFLDAAKFVAGISVALPVWLLGRMRQASEHTVNDMLIKWGAVPEIREVDFGNLVANLPWAPVTWDWKDATALEDSMRRYHATFATVDHVKAIKASPGVMQMVADMYGLGGGAAEEQAESADKTGSAPSEASYLGETTVVESQPEEPGRTFKAYPELHESRLSAVQEAIDECVLEMQKLDSHCEKVFRSVMLLGRPSVDVLRRRAEEFGQPDMWLVEKGVVIESALGLSSEECRVSALYVNNEQDRSARYKVLRDQYDSEKGLKVKARVMLDASFSGWALALDRLLIHNGPQILATLTKALSVRHDYEVVVNQGPPGCGKTYAIVHSVREGDLVMCPARESAMETRKQVLELLPDFPSPRDTISTTDSYLVNQEEEAKQALSGDVLNSDEVYMTSSGRWYAAAGLLGVKQISGYGDKHQIPHVPRVQAAAHFVRIQAQREEYEYIVRRCPATTVVTWAHIYDYKIRSVATYQGPSIFLETDSAHLIIPDGLVILVMYQADKKTVRSKFKAVWTKHKMRVLSVHESEGKTFDHVWLMRFDTRPRADGNSLFDKSEYCLVAMSRHRRSFHYVRPRPMNDLVDKWAAYGADPRAVAAVLDVASAGISMRYK